MRARLLTRSPGFSHQAHDFKATNLITQLTHHAEQASAAGRVPARLKQGFDFTALL